MHKHSPGLAHAGVPAILRAVRLLVIGAGQVGTAVVESLHEQHDVTVVDLNTARLNALSYRYDILTVEGNTSSGSGGSQSNGGGVYARARSFSDVHGFALVDFPN